MAVELNGKVWEKFVEFFRNEKGYSDWTEQEIEDSRNDDDTTEFLEWLVKELKAKELDNRLPMNGLNYIQAALTMYIDYLKDGDEDERDMATRVEATYEELFERS